MASGQIRTLQDKRAIIVNGYATEEITRAKLARWANNLTYVSYYSYGYNRNGDLIPIGDEAFIKSAYNSGVAPLMVLTPFDENGQYSYELVRILPLIRDQLINNIVLTVLEKNYYGVVFNFGSIEDRDCNQFVITVSKTSARLNRKGYIVIVSLVPGLSDTGFDYRSLGKAANFIELRTFYWEHAYEPPSAVSPIVRIREMLARIITVIDRRIILLGLTNYGYHWTLPLVQGAPAEIISHAEAEELAGRLGVAIRYSEVAEAPFYQYLNPSGSQHEVWFENVRSIRAKLDLVREFDLAGVSIWTIMSPFPAAVAGINQMFTVYKV